MLLRRCVVVLIFACGCAAPPPDLAGARALIDRADAAFNAHDADAMNALFDDAAYVGAAARIGPIDETAATARAGITTGYARGAALGARVTRTSLVMRASDAGDVVWFIAEYDAEAPASDGTGPVHRTLRESGVVVHRADGWRIAMLHASLPQPPPPPAPTVRAP